MRCRLVSRSRSVAVMARTAHRHREGYGGGMRSWLVLVVCSACGGEECPVIGTPFDTSVCVEGGLDDIEINGTWHLVGTQTTTIVGKPTTTVNIEESVVIAGACEPYGETQASIYAGCTYSANLAACVQLNLHSRYEDYTLACRDGQGAVQWRHKRHNTSGQMDQTVEQVGMLTR